MAKPTKTKDPAGAGTSTENFKIPGPKRAKKDTKNAYPTFTPNSIRMTRSVAHDMNVKPMDFGLPRVARNTKIPPGIGLEQIPSPGNVKPKDTAWRSRKKEADVNELTVDIGQLTLAKVKDVEEGAEEAGVKTRAGKKKQESKVAEREDGKADNDEVLPEKTNTRTTRSRTTASKTENAAEEPIIAERSDEALRDIPKPVSIKQPVLPKHGTRSTLQRTNSMVPSNLSSPASSDIEELESRNRNHPTDPFASFPRDPTWAKTRNLVLSLKEDSGLANAKKLWEIDEDDIEELKEFIEGTEGGGKKIELLIGMLNVMTDFQAFRASLKSYLEAVDDMDLELDWDGEEAEDGDKEEEK